MPAPELTFGITLAVLAAGFLHAGWNALLKSAPGGDPLLDTATGGGCSATLAWETANGSGEETHP